MVECGVVKEEEGFFRQTVGDGEPVSDEQIRRYLAISRALSRTLSADVVAEELGVEQARVQSFMESLGGSFSLSPIDEGRWLAMRRLLAFFTDLMAGKIDGDERFKATLWLLNVSALEEASREEIRNSLQRAKKIVSEAATKHANPALHWPEDAVVWCAAHLFSEIART